MELTERLPLREINFLNEMDLKTFKQYSSNCKNEEERKQKFEMMKSFCYSNIKTRGEIKRVYSYTQTTPLEVGGRLYCGNSIQGLPKDIRGILLRDISTDIDMKNAHPVILKYICHLNEIACPNLSWYIDHRDEVLTNFGSDGKTAFLKAVNDDKLNKKISDPFFKDFDKECKRIQKEVTALECYKHIADSVPPVRTYNWLGSAINRILCVSENKILQKVISVCNANQVEVCALMFDGLMMYGDHYQNDGLLLKINDAVNEEFAGLNMVFCYKEHSQVIQIPDDYTVTVSTTNSVTEKDVFSGQMTAEEIRCSQSYKTYRTEFEKTHFKLLYPLRYIKEDDDIKRGKSILFYSRLDYLDLLRDKIDMPLYMVKGGMGPTPKKFYELWLDDEHKRKYGKIIFNPLLEEEDSTIEEPDYNSFRGFNNDDLDALEMKEEDSKYVELLRLLMNDDKVFEYMKCWISSIIQRPNIKTKVAPILFSKTHGSGKNTIVEGMIRIFGKYNSGVVESIEDITKNFNGHLCNKLFIYGDEINANAKKVADKLKQVITRTEQNLEKKNQDAIKVDDFTNWLFTTNNENCFKIEEGCRRLMMIACLESIQTKEFYQSVYDEIEDPVKIKQLFKFFKNYKQSEESIKLHSEFKIGQESVYQTQYKKELLFENKPPYIQMFYKMPKHFSNNKFSSISLYEEAQQYAKTHYLSSNFTSQEFSKQLMKYIEIYKKKGNTGMHYIFPDKSCLLKHLFEVDENYYRYVFQLDTNFTPDFKAIDSTKSCWVNQIDDED